jgi:hypothetical protein
MGRNAPRFSLERCASEITAACARVGAKAPNGGAAGSLAAAIRGEGIDGVKKSSSKTLR